MGFGADSISVVIGGLLRSTGGFELRIVSRGLLGALSAGGSGGVRRLKKTWGKVKKWVHA